MNITQQNKKLIGVGSIFLFLYGIVWVTLKFFVTVDNLTITNIAVGQIAIYVFILYILISRNIHHFENAHIYFEGMSAIGRALKKDQLYQSMQTAVSMTNTEIRVTYFSSKSPTESGNTLEEAYQNELEKKIKDNNNVPVRRVIYISDKDSDEKRNWINSQLKIAGKNKRKDGNGGAYTIRFINQKIEQEVSQDAPLINIQIFGNACFIIDPSRKNEEMKSRDVHMISDEITGVWERYFDQIIWEKSVDANIVGYGY